MKDLLNEFLHRSTFERQLGIMVSLGIVLLALFSSVVSSWQSNERVRKNLIEQGRRVTENFAHQSSLALIYGSADNASEAVKATLAFPGVVSLEIRDAKHHKLLSRGKDQGEFASLPEPAHWAGDLCILDGEDSDAWHFIAPVYTRPAEDSPFTVGTAPPELLGYVSVVMSKAELSQTATRIFVSNMAISLSFALLFLLVIRFLTNRMTRPLNQLSESMGLAKAGESNVRAMLSGPKDISDMANAFNNMMEVLDEREAALQVAAIAFEIEQGMIVTDKDEMVIRVNRVFTKLTGYSPEEAIGKSLSAFKTNKDDPDFYPRMQAVLHRANYWQGEIWNRRKGGEYYPEWLTITAVVSKEGETKNYVAAFVDISERKEAEEKIHHLAFYDPLCQLPNRRLLFDRIHQAIATSARNNTCAGLLFIDLDNFKILNDTRGHDVGDLLLIETAHRLRSCIRESDTLARLGGDEFVVLLEGLSSDRTDAAVRAREIGEKMLADISQPYTLKGIEHYSTASIGVSLFANYRQNLDDLLKQADTAMYAAKRAGRNTLRFFDPTMQAALELRSQIEAGMRRALPNNEFLLHYQVQVDAEQKPVGAEALIRWKHPEHGMISPDKFIPIAEDTGQIVPIGHWVLETACNQLKEWEKSPTTSGLSLAVNVSAKQFRQPTFVDQVSEIISESTINPSLLKLELTESTVLENVKDTISKMRALKKIGVRFSMDDFGTGHSSLAYLTQLPLDQMKIDKSFVRNIGTKSTDAVVVQTVIAMAHTLGIDVIAEGVETDAQREFLMGAGCRYYQGYHFGRPVPVDEFNASLTKA